MLFCIEAALSRESSPITKHSGTLLLYYTQNIKNRRFCICYEFFVCLCVYFFTPLAFKSTPLPTVQWEVPPSNVNINTLTYWQDSNAFILVALIPPSPLIQQTHTITKTNGFFYRPSFLYNIQLFKTIISNLSLCNIASADARALAHVQCTTVKSILEVQHIFTFATFIFSSFSSDSNR